MARIGVIADTHVGEFMDALPPEVFTALAGCELIIHCGDICRPEVLDELAALAPVVAVVGDHDRLGTLRLPRKTVVTVEGRRIGVIHGRRFYLLDIAVIVAHVLARRRLRWRAGLHRGLMRRVGRVDALVYGHWHEPASERIGGTLVFSPGAVCPWGSLHGGTVPRDGIAGIADRVVRRYRLQLGPEAMRPSVGVLDVTPAGVSATLVPLQTAEISG